VSVLADPGNWPLEPPLALVVLAAVLYALGLRRRASGRRRTEMRWRTASFYLGLLAIVAALDSPIAAYDDRLFSVHMTQHMLLMMVAPPLVVLSRPWLPLWQPLPLGFRRGTARHLGRDRWAAPLRAIGRFLARPLPVWLLASGTMVLWHIPRLYDATVANSGVHYLEHALFFSTSLLLWMQLIDAPPFHAPLDRLQRAVYALGALTVGWVLAIVLALAPTPLYPAYADHGTLPGGLSPLGDQQLGAGVLWVPGSIALTIAICVNFYLWLAPEGERPPRRLAGQH
jgi:cytochrome c oxidase assembly factor CtaG